MYNVPADPAPRVAKPRKEALYRTAYTTLAQGGIDAGTCVAIRYTHTCTCHGTDWYLVGRDADTCHVAFAGHHLRDFVL